MTITVCYAAVDGYCTAREFKTVEKARAFALRYVGAGAEISSFGYAVSGDGVGKITVEGIDLRELLTGKKAEGTDGAFGVMRFYNCDTSNGSRLVGRYDTVEDQIQALDNFCEHDHAECYHLAVDWKDGRWVKVVPLYNGKTAAEVIAETYPEGPF